jgi:hypothetical protein
MRGSITMPRIDEAAVRARARDLEWEDWATAPAKSLAAEQADMDLMAALAPLREALEDASTCPCDPKRINALGVAIAAIGWRASPRRRRAPRLVKG